MNKCITYIDESGDPGLAKDSSKYFIMAAVILDYDADFILENRLQEFRRKLRWPAEREFKFNRTQKNILREMIDVTLLVDYRAVAVILDKAHYLKSGAFKNEVYRSVLARLLQGLDVKNSKIVLDGTAGKRFRKELLTYLRKEVGNISRRNFRMEDSRKSNGIQLADVIAGALNGSNLNQADATDIWNKVKSRTELIKL